MEMIAGTTYTFDIQTRDFFSNNRKEDMSPVDLTEVIIIKRDSSRRAQIVHGGTCNDKQSHPGVLLVTFTPTVAGNDYEYYLSYNGLPIDQSSVYNSQPLVIVPAATTSETTSNYTNLASQE